MKNKIYTLFLLCLCFCVGVIFSGGCSKNETLVAQIVTQPNAFRVIRQAENSGRIVLTYVFPVNSQRLENLGYNENEISVFKFCLTTYVNALAQANRQKQTEGSQVGGCAYFVDVDGIGFSIQFDNLDAQKKFFGVEDEETENSSARKESGFFIKKVSLSTSFPLSSVQSAQSLQAIFSMAVSSWCEAEQFGEDERQAILSILDESVFIYDFASQSNVLKSDLMYQDETFSHNVFVKTLNDLEENNQITFWVSFANRPVWYGFALGFVGIGMLVAFLVLRKRKQK